jgi:RNA-binding protein YlmH
MNGPAGILDMDDVMNWMSQTENAKSSSATKFILPLKQREIEKPVEDFPLPHKEVKVYREPADRSSRALWRRYFEIMLS